MGEAEEAHAAAMERTRSQLIGSGAIDDSIAESVLARGSSRTTWRCPVHGDMRLEATMVADGVEIKVEPAPRCPLDVRLWTAGPPALVGICDRPLRRIP